MVWASKVTFVTVLDVVSQNDLGRTGLLQVQQVGWFQVWTNELKEKKASRPFPQVALPISNLVDIIREVPSRGEN